LGDGLDVGEGFGVGLEVRKREGKAGGREEEDPVREWQTGGGGNGVHGRNIQHPTLNIQHPI
jgi:hypothetical protein